MTTALQCINSLKPHTLAGFKPGIFCSVGGRDDHYATPRAKIMLFVTLLEHLWCAFEWNKAENIYAIKQSKHYVPSLSRYEGLYTCRIIYIQDYGYPFRILPPYSIAGTLLPTSR
jgi:hypothetical protein